MVPTVSTDILPIILVFLSFWILRGKIPVFELEEFINVQIYVCWYLVLYKPQDVTWRRILEVVHAG